MNYGKYSNPTKIPQSQPIPGKNMKKNNAGGYSFTVSPWQFLTRFLILGTEGGSYYLSEQKLTLGALSNLQHCIQEDGVRVVNEIVQISDEGRAVKNDPAIFALAAAVKLGNDDARKAAYAALPKVCRIGTHLFTFAEALKDLQKGWGRGLKTAVSKWYLDKSADKLAYQVVKYQQRNGWSNRDLLRLSHPISKDATLNAVFKWIVDGTVSEELPKVIEGFELAKKATSAKQIIKLINDYDLPREAIPTTYLNDATVWAALLPKMPYTALMRNLGNLSKHNLLKPLSSESKMVIDKLTNEDNIKAARVHPISILIAMKQYASGRGLKGSGSWSADPNVTSALEDAFYKAFKYIEPTNLNYLLGIDISGSMSYSRNGVLTAAECAAAIAMSIVKSEKHTYTMGFSTNFIHLGINKNQSLKNVLKTTTNRTFGGTDCALPMEYALQNKLDVDVFIVITDNETWAGNIHPSEALKQYNKAMNKKAKLIVLATDATSFTIAEPGNPLMLDIAGFDASVPAAIAEFAKM